MSQSVPDVNPDSNGSEISTQTGLDLTGIGTAMKAIPPGAWTKLVDTACNIVEKALAPVLETTNGLGRLIQAKFDNLVQAEKVLAAETISSATKKAQKVSRELHEPKPKILMQIVESASGEIDSGIRELWSNLLAQELLNQNVHPEVGIILKRISSEDARLLVQIAESKPSNITRLFAEAVRMALSISVPTLSSNLPLLPADEETFNHAHLKNLGLIKLKENKWELTVLGMGFISSVSDPSITPDSSSNK